MVGPRLAAMSQEAWQDCRSLIAIEVAQQRADCCLEYSTMLTLLAGAELLKSCRVVVERQSREE